eukprot:1569908-Prymnesium_polylepis.2
MFEWRGGWAVVCGGTACGALRRWCVRHRLGLLEADGRRGGDRLGRLEPLDRRHAEHLRRRIERLVRLPAGRRGCGKGGPVRSRRER